MRRLIYLFVIALASSIGMVASVDARDHGRRDGFDRRGDARVERPARRERFEGRAERPGPPAFEDRVDRRRARQRARIHDGIHDGELTRRETRRLRHDQRRLGRMDRRFGYDGYYSPRERRIMRRALDRSSRRIERAKHNDWRPRRHWRPHRDWRPRGGWRGYRDWRPYRGWRRHRAPWRWRHRMGYRPEIPVEDQATLVETNVAVTPSYSRALEVDTAGLRVAWNESGDR